MSYYDIQTVLDRLRQLGVNTEEYLSQPDYYKIPIENIKLSEIEQENPTKSKVTSKHTIIIDSRQRNYFLYPNPNSYLIDLYEPHKNVERIELIAAMLPKTEYNVTSENNLILLTLQGVRSPIYLTPGQYMIGSNKTDNQNYISDGTVPVFGLIAELTRVLNTHPQIGISTFNVFLATLPPPNGTGNNASILNRLVITNTNYQFTIDFTNGQFTGNPYQSGSPFRLLGFRNTVYTSNISNQIYGSADDGTCTVTELTNGTIYSLGINSLVSEYDYCILDDPKYCIMQLEFANTTADRVESIDIATNQKFAIIIYDANEPDNIQTYNIGTTNVQIQVSRPPGRLKALKGSDFDKKIITFNPPIIIENFKVTFLKYDNTPYDFHNREHTLTFELDVADYDPKYRY